jgi:hypothetical protein
MTKPDTPIIFIHYGPASYLHTTLRAARQSNPEKRILFLGVEMNAGMAPKGVDFYAFADFETGEEIGQFECVFKFIEGNRHSNTKIGGTHTWLKFVFRRWFLVFNVLKEFQIEAFWTFDSDTLILANLKSRESRYINFDCTEQCLGKCLNGWVESRRVFKNYIECINALFEDDDFLLNEQKRLELEPTVAFYEMDAYVEYRKRAGLRTTRLSRPISGEAFDGALAFPDGFEMTSDTIDGGRRIKKLWSADGRLYARKKSSRQYLRMLTCNMNWMPDYLIRRLAEFSTPCDKARSTGELDLSRLNPISIQEPAGFRVLRQINRWSPSSALLKNVLSLAAQTLPGPRKSRRQENGNHHKKC